MIIRTENYDDMKFIASVSISSFCYYTDGAAVFRAYFSTTALGGAVVELRLAVQPATWVSDQGVSLPVPHQLSAPLDLLD